MSDVAHQSADIELSRPLPWAAARLSPPVRTIACLLLLIFGVQLWLVTSASYGFSTMLRACGVALLLVFIPPLNRLIRRGLAKLDQAFAHRPWWCSIAVGLLAGVYLYAVAKWEGRWFTPRIHDELQFLLQARFLANGKLWMPPHPLADFFDTFYVLRAPVYAPQSFPGWPLMMVPAIWLGLPSWVTPLVLACVSIVLACRLFAASVGGAAAIVGALCMLALWPFRMNAIANMAMLPAQLLGLCAVLAYSAWADRQRTQRKAWPFALLIGVATGWAAITRPIDALCYAVPIGAAGLVVLARARPFATARLGDVATTGACLVAGALPFLVLLFVFNKGVTGSFTRTPFQLYNAIDQPGFDYAVGSSSGAAARRPQSVLPQKQYHWDHFFGPSIDLYHKRTYGQRVTDALGDRWINNGLPAGLTVILLPPALLAIGRSRLWLLAAAVPLFAVGYANHPVPGAQYCAVVTAGSAAVLLLGITGITAAAGRQAAAVHAGLLVLLGTIAVTSSPPFNRFILDEMGKPGDLRQVERTIATVPANSIVLFVPNAERSFGEEPVYNLDVVWPDDARVIRAHDLGEARDRELFAYYAQRQPTRMVYRYDRVTDTLTRLGVVADLAANAGTATAPAPTTQATNH